MMTKAPKDVNVFFITTVCVTYSKLYLNRVLDCYVGQKKTGNLVL